MSRTAVRSTIALSLVLFAAAIGCQGIEAGFAGGMGLEFTYTPILPLSYNIESTLALSLSVSEVAFRSETTFDLSGFQAQLLSVSLDLGALQLSEEILFAPVFERNVLSLNAQIVGIDIGLDLMLANVGTTQTPSYSMGTVLKLGSGLIGGFSLTSLTGFGAEDLVNLLDGVEAPFSHEVLELFDYLETLFAVQPELRVTVVPGFYFEEELIRIEMDTCGLLASTSTWLDGGGFLKEVLEFGYRFAEPTFSFVTALTVNGGFAISGLDFSVDLRLDPVRFTSRTAFAAPTVPSPLPVLFAGQGFAVSFAVWDVLITLETDFDDLFLFDRQLLALDALLGPVAFASLTSFDAGGFAGQWIRAAVAFGGITLYTIGVFDVTGITEITFGFELGF